MAAKVAAVAILPPACGVGGARGSSHVSQTSNGRGGC
ncbi:unnamed protein product [Cuscuta europaea]|uniref:Uncharacterized protein n=1 Tax=Cuscuta europaea TaxID=41803 RepID=A0A9P0ZX05_CUSEU|nr:unnamed protein product [Cuscuta europaea]